MPVPAEQASSNLTRVWVLVVLLVSLSGCKTPFLVFSGGTLAGPEAEVTSFDFASQFTLLTLEVRPEQPYSVLLRVVMRDNELYIDAAERRRWHTHIKANPEVRVQLGETIYPATAVKVTDTALLSQFLAGRTIYRIVPRAKSKNPSDY